MTRQQLVQLQTINNGNEESNNLQQRLKLLINKFDVVADYKLLPATRNVFQRLFDVVNTYYFWNTETRVEQSGRDEQIFANFMIDYSTTQRRFNATIRTPSLTAHIVNGQTPIRLPLISLVRASQKPVHSVRQLFTRLTNENRAQCQISGNHIQTFDGVFYNAPATQCYSVLAKDCKNVEQPHFAVLMKSLDKNGQQKVKIFKYFFVINSYFLESKNCNSRKHC